MAEYRSSEKTAKSPRYGTDMAALSSSTTFPSDTLIAELTDIVLHPSYGERICIQSIAADAGVTMEEMADYYIPTVARDLGRAWCVDQLSFADVSIGTARLQSMLRELGAYWAKKQDADVATSTVLLIVPDGLHHTLGAVLLAAQLRRKGLSVRLLLGATLHNVIDTCHACAFDAVFISTIFGGNLEYLCEIIDSIRAAQRNVPPVVVGGILLETDDSVVDRTGADYATNSVDEAIALCNLKTFHHSNPALDH